MASKTSRTPTGANGGVLKSSSCLAADDIEIDRAFSLQVQARRAAEEMCANGATFTIPFRTDGLQSVLYAMPRGGDRERCRAILRSVKEQPPPFWSLFVAEVAKIAIAEGANVASRS